MTHRVRAAFGRLLGLGLAAALALLVAASSLVAQGTTGKIEGTVTDQQGAAIANAQVTVVGTAFGALTSDKGYYFINNVPVGTYTVRARFIGYTPAEVPSVRVQGGQTNTTNIKLTPSAVAIGPVTVEAAAQPLVPRDQVTSKTIVSGQQFDRLPVQDVRDVIRLEPGVVESGKAKGLSIRGGRPGEAAVYVDGALVRNSQRGESDLTLGTNAVEEASVTTGAIGAEFGDAQSGILAFVTRAGGQKYTGSLSFNTDDMGTLWRNVGFNRFEGSLSGPIKGNLTFSVSGTLTGQKSADTEKNRDLDRPIFVTDGVDTVVTQPATWGDSPTDSVQVAIPRFVQYSGYCGNYGAAAAPASGATMAQAIRSNFGVECQGLRMPFSASGINTGSAKLQYTYGSGSRIALSGNASSVLTRNQPLTQLYNPSAYTGTTLTSYAGTLNWTQNLARSAERAMALDFLVSYQIDKQLSAPLTRQSELDTRNPLGGFLIKPFNYLFDFNYRHDVRIKDSTYQNVGLLDDQQIRCIQAGEGACQDDVPFLNRGDLDFAQPYRMNPYGVEQSARFPMWTQGVNAGIDLSREARWQVRGNFDWQADRYNRIKLGAEFHRIDTRRYNAGSGAISAFGINAYHETPVRYGAYVEDRLDLGDVVIVGGLRYDYYDSRASYPFTPGRISTDSGTFNPYQPDAKFLLAPTHNAWSPRVQVSFPVTERTNFRLSYAHQVQTPDFDLMFRGINTDLSVTNQNQSYGRDVAAYNKDKIADLAGRLLQLADPAKNGETSDFRVLTNADFGNVRGVDVRLDRRFSNLFSGSVAYTFQVARNTGSDPFTYFNTLARQISTLTGETNPPPQAALPTDDNRTNNIVGSGSLSFPTDWKKGTTLGTVLRNVGAFVTFRFASGLPYTRVFPAAEGVTPGGFGLEGNAVESLNSSTRPWFKDVSLRVTKGFRVGGVDWTAFGEARNIFDFKNIVSLFTEVGDVTYPDLQARYDSEQVTRSSVDFNLLGGCENWQGRNAGNFSSGPVDCVLLERAEARYGNGDGVFTPAEYNAAFNSWYNLQNAPSRFYGPGRRVRFGFEISF